VIVTDAVGAYLAELRQPPDPVLAEMEEHGQRESVPIVVPETGQFLYVLALAAKARRVVEVGTAIGVSTLYLARAVAPQGTVISFEIDEERQAAARDYLTRAGLADNVDLRLKDAKTGLKELQGPVDLAFIDGAKLEYADYLAALRPLLGSGSILTVDNVLMSGTVAENRSDGHWSEEHIGRAREFNARLSEDEDFATSLLPLGDGLLVAVHR
jgi:predicted O-methyltransferase YrrM